MQMSTGAKHEYPITKTRHKGRGGKCRCNQFEKRRPPNADVDTTVFKIVKFSASTVFCV